MSLLSQYESSKALQGFTLGFQTFFNAFTYKELNTSVYTYDWNDVRLSEGFTHESAPSYLVKPCSCIQEPSPLVGYGLSTSKCLHCGHTPILAPPSKRLQQASPSRDTSFILELDEFAKEQLKWIQLPKTQQLYIRQRRELKEECQRRINFFVSALHLHFAGQANCHTGKGTCDPYLRDIRNLANLCLKQ